MLIKWYVLLLYSYSSELPGSYKKVEQEMLGMSDDAVILVVDYENSIPKAFGQLFTNGYRVRTATSNAEAMAQAGGLDLVMLIASDRKRECVKLMEHIRERVDPSVNFIVILGGSDDRAFMERIDSLTFQCFRKGRFSGKDLTKAIHNAIEMRALKIREKRFVEDLDRVEDELKKVEHRLYTIASIKSITMREGNPLN